MDDIAKQSTGFTVDQLLNGKLARENFKIDYLPLYKMLDNLDRKIKGGLGAMAHKDIWERIYDFGVIGVGLEKADLTTRVDQLNEKNLELFIKCDKLMVENENLKQQLQESQTSNES